MSLILPAERENTWRWDAGTDELHLYVAPRWLAEMAGRIGRAAPVPEARFAFEDRLLRSLAEALLAERRNGGLGGALYRAAVSETIALHLLRTCCSVGEVPAPARLAPAALRRVRELVEAELHCDLTVDDLATAAGLSRAHFARAFRAATGETPHGYVRQRRVERARRLLAATDLEAATIAGLTGFSSPSHFGRVFKAATGVTPASYRRHGRLSRSTQLSAGARGVPAGRAPGAKMRRWTFRTSSGGATSRTSGSATTSTPPGS